MLHSLSPSPYGTKTKWHTTTPLHVRIHFPELQVGTMSLLCQIYITAVSVVLNCHTLGWLHPWAPLPQNMLTSACTASLSSLHRLVYLSLCIPDRYFRGNLVYKWSSSGWNVQLAMLWPDCLALFCSSPVVTSMYHSMWPETEIVWHSDTWSLLAFTWIVQLAWM